MSFWKHRNNRTRQTWSSGAKIAEDEKLVAFRISQARYLELKHIAAQDRKPITQFINEAIEERLKRYRNRCSVCGCFLPSAKPGNSALTCAKCGNVNPL